ncbi:hypothetical protein A1O1_03415 [Capronia coronata CBS 617.96]|uniref:Uncharacterized protein n=1 Tax=Capronia coronata CBS 617.96 TaxID=1182541 RepID=W9YM51_9EURO|nr:uncharacterized protein A1O1_03415 [Capronia coronata CBS 617.96]EXJ90316.1 hypothetical protein A1O1_03415 [Capronia coronata CBS 617.96]
MPTFTPAAQGSTVHRRIRRTRRRRSHARRFQRQPSPAPPSRRPAKRRRLRDQESLNLQECLYDCQDQGYHLDEEVWVGHGVSLNDNHFSLLDLDVTDPTAVVEGPYSGITNSPPGCAALMHPDPDSSAKGPETKTGRGLFAVRKPSERDTGADTSRPTSPVLPSIPTTPDAAPRVRFPDSYPGPVREEDSHRYQSGYLDGIQIPSPILYHTQSGERLAISIERDFPRFELAYSQPRPEPDFTSYRVSGDTDRLLEDAGPQQYITTRRDQYPTMGNPSWAMNSTNNWYPSDQSGHPNIGQFVVPRPCRPGIGNLAWPSLPYPNPLLEVCQTGRTVDDTVVFPKILPSAFVEDTVSSGHSANNIVQPWANQAASGDEPVKTRVTISSMLCNETHPYEELDRAKEQALTPDGQQLPSTTYDAVKCLKIHGAALSLNPDNTTEKVAYHNAGNRTDLVSAKLGRHQLTGWSPKADGSDSAPHVSRLLQARLDSQQSEEKKVSKMAEWLEGLSHPIDPETPGESSSHEASRALMDRLFDNAVQKVNGAGQTDTKQDPALSAVGTVDKITDSKDNQDHAAEDEAEEAYYTANEDDSDVEMVNAVPSEDGWADWDWEWDVDSNGEEERIGLCATGWEV